MKRVALFLLTNLGVMLVLGLAVNCPVDKVVLRNQNEGPGMGYYPTTIVMDLLLGVVAALIVSWFSRQREFRVDAGAARLMGRKQPISMRWPAWAGWTRARCPSPCNPWASMPAPAG